MLIGGRLVGGSKGVEVEASTTLVDCCEGVLCLQHVSCLHDETMKTYPFKGLGVLKEMTCQLGTS